jgi:hypothetical protein
VHVSSLDVAGSNLFLGRRIFNSISSFRQDTGATEVHVFFPSPGWAAFSFHFKFLAECLIDRKVSAPIGRFGELAHADWEVG